MDKIKRVLGHRGSLGQSLTETALFLPILLILLAGVVEISSMLNTQNRVATAARVGTSFGQTNYVASDWIGTAQSMGLASMNAITETLDVDSERWDVWSIYAKTNPQGTNFTAFTATHVYGDQNLVSAAEWEFMQLNIRSEILANLQSTGINSAKDVEVLSTVSYYGLQSMLGLPVWEWAGYERLRGLTVMRLDKPAPYAGCPLLPILVHYEQYSAYPTNWYAGEPDPNAKRFPDVGEFQGSGYTKPIYQDDNGQPPLNTATFKQNVPGVHLRHARPGYLYFGREDAGPGGFGFLAWTDANAPALRNSLFPFPGDFVTKYPGSEMDRNVNPPPGVTYGNDNKRLEVGEWVRASTGNMNAVSDLVISTYITNGRPSILLLYDNQLGTGDNLRYRVAGFVVAKILGISFTSSDKYLAFEFVSFASECEAP
jgi:hypothetical protein